MWRAAPSAIETGQNSPVTGPQALTRYEYQSVVLLFPSCSMGERPTAREAKTENRVEIFLRGNAKGENEFWTSGRQPLPWDYFRVARHPLRTAKVFYSS